MFFACDRYLYLCRNGLCDFALQGKYITQLTIVAFRPEVFVRRGANQLCMNANPVALSYHRTFDNGIYAQRSGNLRYGEVRVLEAHYRRPRGNSQLVDVGEAPDQVLGHALSN